MEWNRLCRNDVPADSFTDTENLKAAECDTAGQARAFTFRKIPPRTGAGFYSRIEEPLSCTTEIESKPLLDPLNSCIDVEFDLKETMSSSFEWLVWCWDALQAGTKPQKGNDSHEMKLDRIDLQELLEVVSTRIGIEHLIRTSQNGIYIKQRRALLTMPFERSFHLGPWSALA